jgi:hypothetical protein
MAAATALPSLSQVESLDTTYLAEAQQYWSHTGNQWDQVFTEIHESMSTPGGMPWNGQAAAAGQERAYIDMVKVRGATFQLHEAAGTARLGDARLQECKQEVLDAVRDARVAGFEVGEDYSVTDRSRGGSAELQAERLAQAEGHAAFIRHRVAALVAADQELAREITAATEEIENLTFFERPAAVDDKHDAAQPVDQHWKQEPTPTPKPGSANGPSADDIRRVLENLPEGSDPQIKEVRSPEELERLWEWMTRNGVDNPNLYGDLTERELDGVTPQIRPTNRRLMSAFRVRAALPRFTSTLEGECQTFQSEPDPHQSGRPDLLGHRPKRDPLYPNQLRPRRCRTKSRNFLSDRGLPRTHRPPDRTRFTARSTIVFSRRCWAKNPMKSHEQRGLISCAAALKSLGYLPT